MFSNVYRGKKVIITGHTGFKGSWLICWLVKLGAEVVGISKDVPTKPSMFEDLEKVTMPLVVWCACGTSYGSGRDGGGYGGSGGSGGGGSGDGGDEVT